MGHSTRAFRFVTVAVAVLISAIGTIAGTLIVAAPQANADTGDIGIEGRSFSGVTNPPTSDKPQSKLWYNDGLWWATMFHSASRTWHIFRLDRQSDDWVDTGTVVDTRRETLSDALWDGNKLYIGSHWVTVSSENSTKVSLDRPARLYRYSYSSATKSYTLDPGFPATISNKSSESLTIDKDSTGRIWATWTQVSGSQAAGYTGAVYVNSSPTGETWGAPMVLPVTGANPGPDDISGIVAFQRSKIGVLWSNQRDNTMYWAVHSDNAPLGTWTGGIALRGTRQADDHLNLKTIQADQAGRVFAAVKTSLDELSGSSSSDPQIRLLVFKPGTGSWSSTTFGTLADCHTRPIVMLDEENAQVHVIATAPTASGCAYTGAPGTIYEKVAPIDNPVFPPGRGTPIIRDASSAHMNNPTSTKQPVNATTGLVVLASNDSTDRYWHADLALGDGPVLKPTASFTASVTSGVAPLTVAFTDTSTQSPTAWSWDFGDGSTSTQQNPSVTYAASGSYTVTMTASNAAGTSAPATRTITVDEPPGDPGDPGDPGAIVRAASSTSVATAADNGLTIDTPAGVSSGDVLVSCLTLNGSSISGSGTPTGWTRFASATGVSNPHVYGFYKVAGSAEPQSYRWGFSSSVTSSGGIARYVGASGLDSSVSTAAGASSKTASVPGITTTAADTMLLGCAGINSGSTSITISGPTGMSQVWDLGGKRHEFDDASQAAAGPTGVRTWQFSSGREWAGWLAALLPM